MTSRVFIGPTSLFLSAFCVDIGEEHVKTWRWYWYTRGVVHLKSHDRCWSRAASENSHGR